MRKRDRQINFRVTEKEYDFLHEKCEVLGMKMNNFIFYSTIDKEIVIIQGLPSFQSELRKIGINLNQLTKLCNEGKLSCADLSETKKEVNNIWQSLSSLTRNVV